MGINITNITFSMELLTICFIQTDREQLAYPHSEKKILSENMHTSILKGTDFSLSLLWFLFTASQAA